MTPDISVREGRATDRNFVINSWLKSYFLSRKLFAPWSHLCERDYFEGHHRVASAVIDRAALLVACDVEDADQIFGWACYERPFPDCVVLHYIYVKAPYRGWGIGRKMFDAIRAMCGARGMMIVTHWTKDLRSKRADLKYKLEVNPYYLWSEQ